MLDKKYFETNFESAMLENFKTPDGSSFEESRIWLDAYQYYLSSFSKLNSEIHKDNVVSSSIDFSPLWNCMNFQYDTKSGALSEEANHKITVETLLAYRAARRSFSTKCQLDLISSELEIASFYIDLIKWAINDNYVYIVNKLKTDRYQNQSILTIDKYVSSCNELIEGCRDRIENDGFSASRTLKELEKEILTKSHIVVFQTKSYDSDSRDAIPILTDCYIGMINKSIKDIYKKYKN